MHEIRVRNVNYALQEGATLLATRGVARSSRYGDTVEVDEPVVTHYERPMERVLFDPVRDANPFFHLFESLWILAGRADVAFLTLFNKRMAEFSDDGNTFHAPYGFRLRNTFDQIAHAIRLLREDPTARRVVLQIWDAPSDLGAVSKDIPCNDAIKLEARDGKLNMVVFCRSNDMVWGAYGANVVQFSMIQQYIAEAARLPVGWYEQVSCNFHAYEATLPGKWSAVRIDPYADGRVVPYGPMMRDAMFREWDADNRRFCAMVNLWDQGNSSWWTLDQPNPSRPGTYGHPYFTDVAEPMFLAWVLYKQGSRQDAIDYLGLYCKATDWQRAGMEWITRRIK